MLQDPITRHIFNISNIPALGMYAHSIYEHLSGRISRVITVPKLRGAHPIHLLSYQNICNSMAARSISLHLKVN